MCAAPQKIGPRHKLYGVQRKIDRAAYHLEVFKRHINDFLGEKHYEVSEKVNSEAGTYIFRVKPILAPPGTEWGILLGEIVHNLRSALDNLAWQLALLTKESPYRYTCFPIYKDDTDQARRDITRILQDVSIEAQDIIKELQPYHSGDSAKDHALWILHGLWNTDKHKIIPLVPFGLSWKVPKHPDIASTMLDDASVQVVMPIELRNQIDFKPEVVQEVSFRYDERTEVQSVNIGAIFHAHQAVRDLVLPRFLRFFPPQQ